MSDLDLYAIHGLDRSAPSPDLAAQLTAQLNGAADPITRQRLDTARAILGDPQRRQAYDAQLGNPQAPQITEAVLAALAGRPTPAPAKPTLAQPRILAAIAAFLGVLLVIVVSAVACSGGDDDSGKSTVGADGSTTTAASGSDDYTCWVDDRTKLDRAAWLDDWTANGNKQPHRVLVLTKAIDLPSQFASMATDTDSRGSGIFPDYGAPTPANRLVQFQDKNIGVVAEPKVDRRWSEVAYLAIVDQSGKIVSTSEYTQKNKYDFPQQFDRAANATFGYYRVEASDGITIPAAANGNEKNMNFALAILPDAFDKTKFWVLMRGSDKLYQAGLYGSNDWSKLGQSADVKDCVER